MCLGLYSSRRVHIAICCELNVSSQNSYVKVLTNPGVLVFEDGAFGTSLGLDLFMRMGPW